MTKRMLIDASHHEETRVAIVEGDRLEEFDYESSFRKALKGSIFLAKVTRVEPSLQAAFVNFGGNRHGFLPYSEIHPDYFRIPIADREALMAEQEEALREAEAEDALEDDAISDDGDDSEGDDIEVEDEAIEIEDIESKDAVLDDEDDIEDGAEAQNSDEAAEEGTTDENAEDAKSDADADSDADAEESKDSDKDGNSKNNRNRSNRGGRGNQRRRGGGRRTMAVSNQSVESFGGESADEEQRFRFRMRRKYKIQEVIKRGQIILVQASKEERGNKGAAFTSYLSLPGRYCVLMPNSPRAGGVSRKISNNKDRAKMRELLKDLEVPKGMSVILRTAGVTRTKAEVKRDLEYLLRLWQNTVDLTKESFAPAAVYEEANLVKRAVRDLYSRDVEEIVISGEESYKVAKDFMKMMIPSHVKKVREYKDNNKPLFQRYGIEKQIFEIGETTVTLKSGGYLVINPTEALVSVDVNSGKATKERHIEDTAVKTNLEAAEEVARQLRLRDLGGLVVIDFIDMEDRRNNAKVERRMRDSLSGDRARIQMGRISSFGLMELSRQRLNPSLGESQFGTCPHCEGTGRVRTADAASIMLLRAIEEEAARGRAAQIIVHVPAAVALYVLNNKREHLSDLEKRFELAVLIRVDDDMGAASFRIEVSKPAEKDGNANTGNNDNNQNNKQDRNNNNKSDNDDETREGNSRRRGRRGGRRRNNNADNAENTDNADNSANAEGNNKPADNADGVDASSTEEKPKPKRGRKPAAAKASKADEKAENTDGADTSVADASSTEDKPKPKRGRKPAAAKADKAEASNDDKPALDDAAQEQGAEKSKAKPKAKSAAKPKKVEADADKPAAEPKAKAKKPAAKAKAPEVAAKPVVAEPVVKDYETVNEAPKNKKKGWWSKVTS